MNSGNVTSLVMMLDVRGKLNQLSNYIIQQVWHKIIRIGTNVHLTAFDELIW